MFDEKMQKAMEEFVTSRINDFSQTGTDALQSVYDSFRAAAVSLKETLSPAQKELFTQCENAFSLLEGETQRSYYKAGFADAVSFLLSWRQGT